jgi:ATP-dependent helicase HrpB
LPGGRPARLDYRSDGRVVLSVRIQQIIGLAVAPRIGAGRTPVTFEILAPSGRPVQITSDLENFWRTVYPEIRPALRARYPKHRWP